MDGLGDLVLFRSALEYYPEVFGIEKKDITILGCHSWKSLADTIFAGYRVVTIDEHAYERKFLYRLKISRWVAQQCFKIAVCDIFLRKPMTCEALLYYSYAEQIIVSAPFISKKTKPRFDYYWPLYDKVIDTGNHPRHETLRHFSFISQLANRDIKPQPPYIPWSNERDPISQKPYVTINFGSNAPGRRWPFEYFLEIAKRVIERGYYAVFLGGAAELVYSKMLDENLQHPNIINYIGKTKNLSDVLDVLKHSQAVITSETGPGHFALALHIPTLMLCGGGSHSIFTPFPESIRKNTMHFLNFQMDCYHCLWHCPYRKNKEDSFPCLANIKPNDAWAIFEKLVPAYPPPAPATEIADPALVHIQNLIV